MKQRYQCPTCGGYFTLKADGKLWYHTKEVPFRPSERMRCPGSGGQRGPALPMYRP